MGDDDGDALARLDRRNRLDHGGFTFRIKIGVRLVQHHDEGIAVKRAGKPDALALPGRKGRARLADIAVIALFETQDQFMRSGSFAAAMMASGSGLSSKREIFSPIVPSNSSTPCGR